MPDISYHISHEQFKPSVLLRYAQLAEKSGFTSLHSSDHFHPWSERQGESGFSFSWIGAALQATSLPCGVVCAPGQRYHPAIIAQAAATLSEMFPGRFWMSMGNGEALNESITGDKWPSREERNTRLLECVQVIRRLLNGETVSHKGLVTIENARLYTLPVVKPLIFGAALSAETAAWVAGWADGLITTFDPYPGLTETLAAFRENGGAGKPLCLKVQLSYSRDEDAALSGAYDQWRTNIFGRGIVGEVASVAGFDALGEFVRPEHLRNKVRISSRLDEHIHWIREDMKLGVDKIILHNVNREQEVFLDDFGKKVLPAVMAP